MDDRNILYKVVTEYQPEELSYFEDVKREETFRRIIIPQSILKDILKELIKEDKDIVHSLYRPFFRSLSFTGFILAIIGVISIGLVASFWFAIPFIIASIFSLYTYFYLKER